MMSMMLHNNNKHTHLACTPVHAAWPVRQHPSLWHTPVECGTSLMTYGLLIVDAHPSVGQPSHLVCVNQLSALSIVAVCCC